MQAQRSVSDLATTAAEASTIPKTDNMGRAYRTPSPAKSVFVSSKSSPISAPAVASQAYMYEDYMQHSKQRALGIAAPESEVHPPRQMTTSSDLPDAFSAHWSPTKPSHDSSYEKKTMQPQIIKEPRTSTKTRVRNLWHGLPSPETPTFNDNRLAQEPKEDIGPTTVRRSGRLRAQPKPTYTHELHVVASRKVAKVASAKAALGKVASAPLETSEQPEYRIAPFEADPITFEGLPTVHSLCWQLQYPPGGSTHPAYPFPSLDPRLIFHQAMVPVVDNLPDFTRVPKLLLPIGWKHVSWSGLLPIAFDPYRQAFKLTPVGPIPITCEELRQGGLHKYVPGGELHPEYGMLPEMVKLSDGSDGEVFDFEGVDWTLPWDGNTNLRDSQILPTPQLSRLKTSFFQEPLLETETALPSFINFGVRDCPDGIMTLEDAWKWLITKEENPKVTFQPDNSKTWKQLNILPAHRKIKQPIPALMATALVEEDAAYLANQDAQEYCPMKSVATPPHVNITLLGTTEFTLMELLCYFPNHYHWRKGGDRLALSGLNYADMANIVNMTRQLTSEVGKTSAAFQATIVYEKQDDGSKTRIVRSDSGPKDYTAQGWTYSAWEPTDYPLLGLAHGLRESPSGDDAGPLTKLMSWCRDQRKYTVMLSEVPALLVEANIDSKIQRDGIECPDKVMLPRHVDALKEDRKRVLREKKIAKKRAMSSSVEAKKEKKRRIELSLAGIRQQ